MGDFNDNPEDQAWNVQLVSLKATRWVDGLEWFRTIDSLHRTFDWNEREGELPPWGPIFQHYEVMAQYPLQEDRFRWLIPAETPEHVAGLAIALIEGNIPLIEKALAWFQLMHGYDMVPK